MSNDLTAQKLKIPTAWMVAVLGALGVGSGGSAAYSKVRMDSLERQMLEQRQEQKAELEAKHQHDLELQSINLRLGFIEQALKRLETRL